MNPTFIILLQLGLIFAQSIPNNQFLYQSRKLLYDAGQDWESLTNFGPIRFKPEPQNKLKNLKYPMYYDYQIGINAGNKYYSLYGFGRFKYNNHYYGYFYPSFENESEKSHIISLSSNFNNNHGNASGIGFENNWATLQIGRGKESWGSGNDIQLALSENSESYDYFLLGSNYGNVRVRYIHGFLENVKANVNRYITARGFEWTNKKTLIIGFSETVIYSGENRALDIGYINPVSSHLEIELNNRLNIVGDRNSNAVWQVHLDYMIRDDVRFSLNYLYDELVFDPDIEIGKEHGKAYSVRLAYTPYFDSNYLITIISSLVHVGTPTFRHGIGTNNFVQSGKPIGWYGGSDSQEASVGINYFNNNNFNINISSGIFISGEETIINRTFDSYADYLKGSFPSGKVKEKKYFRTSFTYLWKENYSIFSSFYYSQNNKIINFKLDVPIF